MIKVRLATLNDIKSINLLYKNVIRGLNEKKIDMLWGDVYPFCEVENDINSESIYILEFEENIIGSFVLSDFDDPDYHDIEWTNNDNFIYLNRLVVDPLFQGRGFAMDALELIENQMKDSEYKTIRLTVYERNYPAINLYEKFGFKKVNVGFWQLEDKKFIGYEKEIKSV